MKPSPFLENVSTKLAKMASEEHTYKRTRIKHKIRHFNLKPKGRLHFNINKPGCLYFAVAFRLKYNHVAVRQ